MKKLMCVLLALFFVASSLSCSSEASDSPGSPDSPKAATGVNRGDKFTDFQLKDLAGKTVETAVMRKGQVFVLKFGATWCPPCTAQIPHLNKVVSTAEYAGKVAVLEVDIKEPAAKVKAHTARHGAKYTTVLDLTGAVAGKFAVRGIPTTLVVDKAGTIAYRGYFTPYQALKQTIDGLLTKK